MSLHITHTTKSAKVRPTTRDKLRSIIEQELKRQGPDADLNFIDTSEIDDMPFLFYHTKARNIKIDEWNVSNVTNMANMFDGCKDFNCDLSDWNVSNVKTMSSMFFGCSEFKSNLSKWETRVSNVRNMTYMFGRCKKFKSDLSNWNVLNVIYYNYMFDKCHIAERYKPKLK